MYLKLIGALALLPLTAVIRPNRLIAQKTQAVVLTPRQVGNAERTTLANSLTQRFQERVPSTAEVRGAGAYRFISTDSFHYADRSDLGSVAFELAEYGTGSTSFDSIAITRSDLLKRVDASLSRGNFRADGRIFTGFQDEFAGSTQQPRGLSIQLEPRSVSRQVARTAEYRRVWEGLPVFGSELLIGFMPDGRIGRFRMHWPQIPAAALGQARELQRMVAEKRWKTPDEFQGSGFEILEVSAGVGHSSFADPRFKVAPVVRVVYRKVGKDREYPLSSTGYKYFDASGREILFSDFPVIPGTTATRKGPRR